MNTKLLYLPTNLPEPPEALRDAAHYILHRCYVGRALWDTRDAQGRSTMFTRLYSGILQTIAHNYRAALDWLLENELLETDNHFVVGKKSRGYRWTAPYDEAVRIRSSRNLSQKITERSRQVFRNYTKAHRHLIHWLGRATMDTAAAYEFVRSVENTRPEINLMTTGEYQMTLSLTIRLIVSGDWKYTTLVCDYGRFHSPYTALLSDLRQFVSFDGLPLINVDIANSQPLILSLLFPKRAKAKCKDELISESLRSHSLNSPRYTLVDQASDSVGNAVTTSGNGSFENVLSEDSEMDQQHSVEEDMYRYIHDCEAGQFYETLMRKLHVGPNERDQFKRDVFREIFYGAARERTALREAFIASYPSVWNLICQSKRGDYRKLSWAMQRAESRLMIDTIISRFSQQLPKVPLITVHDSILTTAPYVQIVKDVMTEEFEQVGLRPTLKETRYRREIQRAA